MKPRATTPRAAPALAAALVLALLATLPAPCAAAADETPPAAPPTTLARGKFLVATKRLGDPNFRETVILMLEYEAHGALGVVINRPTDVKLALVLPDVEELQKRTETVFLGGPVARDHMVLLVRTATPPEDSERILDGVFVTSSLDVLRRTLRGTDAGGHFRAFVGYAGWAPRQLEDEIARGDWSVVAGEASSLFDKDPSRVWPELHERAAGQWVRAPAPSPRTLAAAGAPATAPALPLARVSARSAASPCRRRRGMPAARRRSP